MLSARRQLLLTSGLRTRVFPLNIKVARDGIYRKPPAPLSAFCSGRCADMLIKHARDGIFARCADHPLFFLATLEENQSRDALDAVALRDRRILVNVELDDARSRRIFLGHSLDRRREHATGRAPSRPKVH